MSFRTLLSTCLLVPVVILGLWLATGGLTPTVVPDSWSYVEYPWGDAAAMARSIRTPGYPLVLRLCGATSMNDTGGLSLVCWIQALLHVLVCQLFALECRRWCVPAWVAQVLAVILILGNTAWHHLTTVASDSLAFSVGVLSVATVLRLWRLSGYRSAVALGGLVTLAIAIRPAYLSLLMWTPAMVLLQPRGTAVRPTSTRRRQAGVVLGIPFVWLLCWCGFRGVVAGDFGLLPFGHQNLAGVTVQLVDNEELERLLPPADTIARKVAGIRAEMTEPHADAGGMTISDPFDSRPRPPATRRASSATDLENRWDVMTYSVVIPAAAAVTDGDIIEQHRALSQLNRAIITTYPQRYLRWWLLGVRRGIWGSVANVVMHPVFLVAFLCLAGLCFLRSLGITRWKGNRPRAFSASPLSNALAVLALSYALMGISFVALTSPPIGRFADAAFAFVPVWFGLLACQWVTADARGIKDSEPPNSQLL
ncbi:MAG: hypothetical protein AAGD07_01345 [Planctomycetota bacterium]